MLHRHLLAVTLSVTAVLIAGCASAPSVNSTAASAKIEACRAGDTSISGPNQCLQDDAACYQTRAGNWCTGERGVTCPAGSVQIPSGSACPAGMRCFEAGESLSCAISYQ